MTRADTTLLAVFALACTGLMFIPALGAILHKVL